MTEPTPIRKNRRYSKREKVTAVIAASMSSVQAASEQTGIPVRNIGRWRDDPRLAEYATKTREEVGEGFKMLTGLAIDRLAQLIPTMEPRDLVILAGVGVDKSQLLSGAATSRLEHRELLTEFDDHETDAMRDWLHEMARQRLEDASAGS